MVERFYEKIGFGLTDCWYWIGFVDKDGYGRTSMLGEKSAHRLSWILYFGDIPKGNHVLHKCDVPNCVNPHHLFLGNQKDNNKDMKEKHRNKVPKVRFGEFCNLHKLTNEKVLEMRKLREEKRMKFTEIAQIFNVSVKAATRAINKKSWRHI